MKTALDLLDIIVSTLPLENFIDLATLRTTTALDMYNISDEMIMKGEY